MHNMFVLRHQRATVFPDAQTDESMSPRPSTKRDAWQKCTILIWFIKPAWASVAMEIHGISWNPSAAWWWPSVAIEIWSFDPIWPIWDVNRSRNDSNYTNVHPGFVKYNKTQWHAEKREKSEKSNIFKYGQIMSSSTVLASSEGHVQETKVAAGLELFIP